MRFQTDALKSLCDWLALLESIADWQRASSSQHQFESPSEITMMFKFERSEQDLQETENFSDNLKNSLSQRSTAPFRIAIVVSYSSVGRQ